MRNIDLILALAIVSIATAQEKYQDGVFQPSPSKLTPGAAPGVANLSPNDLMAAQLGEFTLTITLGEGGVAVGGGLLVDFPKTWFTNPVPLQKPVQTNAPNGFHYLGARSSNSNAQLKTTIEKTNFDGKNERFRNMLVIVVEGAALNGGDQIFVTFANTTAPYLKGADEVKVAIDAAGNGEYRHIALGASYTVHPGPAASLQLVGPSLASTEKRTTLWLTVFDRFYNVVEDLTGSFTINGFDSGPVTIEVDHLKKGMIPHDWTPRRSGYIFPVVNNAQFDEVDRALAIEGNPIHVYDFAELGARVTPPWNVYWGDLHSHSSISKDGIGSGDFAYARDASRLDFFASTEHDISDNAQDSITPSEWETIKQQVTQYYQPGRFVTLLAYECSLGGGHHNVFYRTMDGVPWPSHRLQTIENIWSKLKANDAITIPHHLGIRWGRSDDPLSGPDLQEVKTGSGLRGGPQVSWAGRKEPELRPVLEIYSEHGQSEFFDPNDPLAYEQVRYTGAVSVEGPHYARDAWALGHVAGAVAASDNHVSHPGLAHTGLTAVFAQELTREAIFDALLNRRCYGTTGERILLEFEVNGSMMGQTVDAKGDVQGRVFVAAPRPIRYAEVLVYNETSRQWEQVARWEPTPPRNMIEEVFSVSPGETTAPVYLRVELEGTTNGRVSRAWSSPIWLAP